MNQPVFKGNGTMYSSTYDCFRKTVLSEGPLALFKGLDSIIVGWVPQWVRLGPHTIITFLMLEQLRLLSNLKPV